MIDERVLEWCSAPKKFHKDPKKKRTISKPNGETSSDNG